MTNIQNHKVIFFRKNVAFILAKQGQENHFLKEYQRCSTLHVKITRVEKSSTGYLTNYYILKNKSRLDYAIIMPLVTVSMYPGRTQEQKNQFAEAITKSAVEILKTKEQEALFLSKKTILIY